MFHWILNGAKDRLLCSETGAMYGLDPDGGITYWEPGTEAGSFQFATAAEAEERKLWVELQVKLARFVDE